MVLGRDIQILTGEIINDMQAEYGTQRLPYSPATLLYAWWQNSQSLANYEQQDAHEFFLTFLGSACWSEKYRAGR